LVLPGVVEFARGVLGIGVDGKQEEFLTCGAKQGILNCSRQWGKSTVAAVKVLHTLLEAPERNVVVIAPSKRQSGEFLRKVKGMVGQLGMRGRKDGVNELSLQLGNGSRVVALPGVEGTLRGFSAVDLLIVDEAARVTDHQYYASTPMLARTNGNVWLLSTPFGARGFFWKEWEQGGEDWARIQVRAEECGRIPEEFLERERRRMGSEWFRQEYECEFLSGEGMAFRRELLEAMVVEGLPDLFEGFDGGLG
jgi:hypothetical protein